MDMKQYNFHLLIWKLIVCHQFITVNVCLGEMRARVDIYAIVNVISRAENWLKVGQTMK